MISLSNLVGWAASQGKRLKPWQVREAERAKRNRRAAALMNAARQPSRQERRRAELLTAKKMRREMGASSWQEARRMYREGATP